MYNPLEENDDNFISTGFSELDRIICGFRNSGLYAIGGAPGMGKTTLVFSMILKIAEYGIPVSLFSYEMSDIQIEKKLLSIIAEIENERISKEELNQFVIEQSVNGLNKLNNLPIHLETSSRMRVNDIGQIARTIKEEKGIKIIFIDDIQRVPIDNAAREFASNREQEISANVRELKRLARELNIPIVIISQLNRLNEGRGGDRKPSLIDLRDSGAIENDSDVVMFLYRPEYYGFFQDEDGNSNKSVANIIVAKNRYSQNDSVRLKFNSLIPKFENDMDEHSDEVFNMPSKMDFSDFNDFDSTPF